MPQIKFRADTKELDFPLLSTWAGRSVMKAVDDIGQHVIQESTVMYQPGVIYAQDVLPLTLGYKSVSYSQVVAASTDLTFSFVYTVTDPSMNMAQVGVTTDSQIWMITGKNFSWTNVTPANWSGGDAVTTAEVGGSSYLYLAQFGCYRVDVSSETLVAVTLIGIAVSDILGITSAVNYLILWDTNTIYWNSNINPLDFTPSLITGAGSETPDYLKGGIILVLPLDTGMVIYSSLGIVNAAFSNNTQYPWVFTEIPNGAGISSKYQVSHSRNLGFHLALTYAGLLKITSSGGAQVIAPEVSDFLSALIYETYDFATNSVVQTALTAPLMTRVAVIASRYLVVSYGITSLTDCIVYDSALNRWGRLHVPHVQITEIETSTATAPIIQSYSYYLGTDYYQYTAQPYNFGSSSFNSAPPIGHVLGVVQSNGTILQAYLNYTSDTDAAVLVMGKFQLVRDNLIELQEVDVESIPSTSVSFGIQAQMSLDGLDLLPPTPMVEVVTGASMRTYKKRLIGMNYNLIFTGSFYLTTVVCTAVLGGRR